MGKEHMAPALLLVAALLCAASSLARANHASLNGSRQAVEALLAAPLNREGRQTGELLPIPRAASVISGSDLEKLDLDLEKLGGQLLMVQAVFRHGARTPLTDRYILPSHTWRHCAYAPKASHRSGLESRKLWHA